MGAVAGRSAGFVCGDCPAPRFAVSSSLSGCDVGRVSHASGVVQVWSESVRCPVGEGAGGAIPLDRGLGCLAHPAGEAGWSTAGVSG